MSDVFRYETFWRRFWASVIDWIVFIPMVWLGNWMWANVNAQPVLVTWYIVDSFAFLVYSIVLQGLFGQTIGKRLTGVKIYDASGGKLSMRQAALRDAVLAGLTLVQVAAALLPLASGLDVFAPVPADSTQIRGVTRVVMYAAFGWWIIELVTMLMNDRRRALHDFIAGSVVMRVQPETERMAESPASS